MDSYVEFECKDGALVKVPLSPEQAYLLDDKVEVYCAELVIKGVSLWAGHGDKDC